MMSETCSVKEMNINMLIGNGVNHQEEGYYKNKYIIPNFQRGYRWTKDEVEHLLNDIWSAIENKMEKYCLQPIIVLKKDDCLKEGTCFGTQRQYTERKWNVIDGQQRLTTVFLILKYLFVEDVKGDCYDIEYETRDQTNDKIHSWIDAIVKRDIWNSPFPLIDYHTDDSLDVYYLSNALRTIKEWFEKKPEAEGIICKYLRKNVICLWYEFSSIDGDEITLFSRVNMGKIPLTISELMKALLLKADSVVDESSTENSPLEFEKNKKIYAQKKKLAEEHQYQRAVQWDKMEQALSEEGFFRFIYPGTEKFETRMDYLFLVEYLLDNPDMCAIAQNEVIFRYYEKRIGEMNEKAKDGLWEKLLSHFSLLQEWYNDKIAFHKIGFIVATENHVNHRHPAIVLRSLFQSYAEEANCSGKAAFYGTELDKAIKSILEKKKIRLDDLDNLSYDADKDEIQIVLLLFNILTAMKSPDYRFSFEYVFPLEEGGSLEHIFPQTPRIEEIVKNYSEGEDKKAGREKKALERFVKSVETEFKMIGKTVPEFDWVKRDDEELRNWWIEVMDEIGISEETVQGIGNIALISKNLNTRLTNNMFFAKQKKIKQFDKEGKFIPICTHNVFLKYYSICDGEGDGKTSGLFWEKEDMEKHKEAIKTVVAGYLL